jgi:hypothetical protein
MRAVEHLQEWRAKQRQAGARIGPHEEILFLLEWLDEILTVVEQQAEDKALWFIADLIVEAYFQQELRRLHAVIERES